MSKGVAEVAERFWEMSYVVVIVLVVRPSWQICLYRTISKVILLIACLLAIASFVVSWTHWRNVASAGFESVLPAFLILDCSSNCSPYYYLSESEQAFPPISVSASSQLL